ncbi:Ferredoxin--NADP(+) reductase [Sphingobium chlorophenolicum L-1]|uniref:ferredoxin--NADP(+) reductase n=1 Tax=Sphingobium chlorophenolicum L-1 TaxID=690566 RepID=F6EWB6_SPHCR|nr:ferredoxin--NADP reductase [Sphingobium chlorophenolicum]AEG49810.1 Ferredoxin--NADP(+) reductase [Sphingobium chlorophenolicum L-1]
MEGSVQNAGGIQATKTYSVESVTSVHHWTDELFSFRTTRDDNFDFVSGQFVMVGLMVDGQPILRAYSIASGIAESELEFFSVKVPNGPLTSRLQNVKAGDPVLVGRKPTGSLVLNALKPGRRLYMLGTGTGLAPWLSLIRDPAVYSAFDEVIVIHSVRQTADLAYRDVLEGDATRILPQSAGKLRYYPTVTREDYRNTGRITELMKSGKLLSDLNVGALDPKTDRIMICGSPPFNTDVKALLGELGFAEGALSAPGDFVLEKAFVEG